MSSTRCSASAASVLAVAYPEIAEMQARAIFLGAVDAGKKTGKPVTAEIMLPVIFGKQEFDLVKPIIVASGGVGRQGDRGHGALSRRHHDRAAARGAKGRRIAESAEFFSFGTNDLTQTTLGMSRDDAASFLGLYTAKGLLPADPFVTLDTEGVGELSHRRRARQGDAARHQARRLRRARRRSGLDRLLRGARLDYVSCSPFRIPIARLAAAQAALHRKAHSTA